MTETLERRTLLQPVEFRAEGKSLVARGYAAVWNELSQDLGGFRERMLPGAFDEVLSHDVVALVNHDPNRLLGRSSAGTLRLESDNTGLGYEIDLPDTTDGRDAAVLLERGDFQGSSFTFRVAPDGQSWTEDEDGTVIRSISGVSRLRDVGPVTFPAYLASEAALKEARSLVEAIEAAATPPATTRQGYRWLH